MSKREWKPGAVALVEAGCWANQKVALRLAEGWSHVNGVSMDGDGIVSPVRPLVVIDPEDREQVERLWTRYQNIDIYRTGGTVDDMQAALREFANPTPPKPDEPTGLGAVVEDADGKRWIRVTEGDASPWAPLGNVGFFTGWRHYRQISAVRVLSEGVTQ